MIELYGHVSVAPVMQLGLGHRELSRVYNDVVRSLPGTDPR
ncbi:hypothetical protein [Arthrobacter sp. zg-Y877]|nr:hypothetical protein [Arthrobacter sp. zg-Y877]MDM7989037.1 hypothetical protein [Arthrobacter sp. zg-Y877]